jgi:adenylyl-sulfate kinase
VKRATVFWFTGLSGSGKSSIAKKVCRILRRRNKKVKIYDGDAVRKTINRNLAFSAKDIMENNRIISELCRRDAQRYDYIFVPVISPFSKSRKMARKRIGKNFRLVYVKASLDTVIKRDAKGLYKKALAGRIDNFIGIDRRVPFEAPSSADLVLDTEREGLNECSERLFRFVKETTGN